MPTATVSTPATAAARVRRRAARVSRRIENVAELLASLGGISPERVRLQPPPGTATVEDLLERNGRRVGPTCELIDGALVEKAMGFYESRLAHVLAFFIEDYLSSNPLGIVLGPDGTLRMFSGNIRIPDVSFLSWDHFPGHLLPQEQVPAIPPDLAVEVLSPDNTRAEIERKKREYFESGTKLVWILDPRKRTLRAYTSPNAFVQYGENDPFDGGIVLPGLRLTLSQVFQRAGRRAGRGA